MAPDPHRAHRHGVPRPERRRRPVAGGRFAGGPRAIHRAVHRAVRPPDPEMTVEGHGHALGPERDVARVRREFHAHPVEPGLRHLARQRTVPDQAVERRRGPVETPPGMRQTAIEVFRRAGEVGRADRFMGFLRVPRPGTERPRLRRHMAVPEVLADGGPRLRHRGLRHRRRIGPHVGDQSRRLAADLNALVQPLRRVHGLGDGEAEPPRGLVLQGRGGEGRRRAAAQRIAFDRRHREPRRPDARCRILRRRGRRKPVLRDRGPVQTAERGREDRAVLRPDLRPDRPVAPRREGLDPGLALADQAQRHRLHPARRAAARQLAPEHRREPVADQVVERTARPPRLDQVHVERPRALQRRAHRVRRHLVERDPADRRAAEGAARFQPGQHLPGDRLALAVRVGRQHQGLGAPERPGDRAQRPGRPPAGLGDHGEPVLRLHRARTGRQVRDMPPGRERPVFRSQILRQRARLGRRFDHDHMPPAPAPPAGLFLSASPLSASRHGPPSARRAAHSRSGAAPGAEAISGTSEEMKMPFGTKSMPGRYRAGRRRRAPGPLRGPGGTGLSGTAGRHAVPGNIRPARPLH